MEFETEIDEYSLYRIGISDGTYEPNKRKYNNMLHLVAYDVRNPRRLAKVAKICKDYGFRVEYSVFECDLSPEDLDEMISDLEVVMDMEIDTLIVYRICATCVEKIMGFGTVSRPGKILFYMP